MWPITIIKDHECNSGYNWLAFNKWPEDILEDTYYFEEAKWFWAVQPELTADLTNIGLGNTPEAAVEDLEHKMADKGANQTPKRDEND
jgi:hypothetical protein